MTLAHRLPLLIAILSSLIFSAVVPAQAGETSVYLKSGWFTWEERLRGERFVKEDGFMHGFGVTHDDQLLGRFELSELLEVWGGNLDYDGHDVTGSSDIKTDTSYLGTREEVFAGILVPLGRSVILKPLAGLGHKFWIRTRSSEDWNMIFAKAGMEVRLRQPWGLLFAKGGAMLPFYVRNHVSMSDAGFEDVAVHPETRVSAFAEGGINLGTWTFSIEYEDLRFSESPKVLTKKLGDSQTGAAIVNNLAFQPASDSSLVSLKISYQF